MKKNNPFLITSYVSPKFFCDRKNETERIIYYLRSSKNLIIHGREGIGKTTLIKHILFHVKKEKDIATYYINTLNLDNIHNIPNVLLMQVSGKKKKNLETKFVDRSKKGETFNELLTELDIQNRKTIIILDDIDKLNDLNNLERENVLNSISQNYDNIRFILIGNNLSMFKLLSRKNSLLNEENYNLLEIDTIDKKTYKKFLIKRFFKSGRKVGDKSIDQILNFTRSDLYLTQYICRRLFEKNENKITFSDVKHLLEEILVENEIHFVTYKNLLSTYQWKLLSAIAKEGIANQITSGEFIRKHSLNAPSSVKTAEKSLIEKYLIYKDTQGHHISNVLLERWITKS